MKQIVDTSKISRVEVINYSKDSSIRGRVYSWINPGDEVEISIQDEGATLKIFISSPKENRLKIQDIL